MMFLTKFRVINYGSRLKSTVESIMYIKEKHLNFRFRNMSILDSININDIYNIQFTILILKTKYY